MNLYKVRHKCIWSCFLVIMGFVSCNSEAPEYIIKKWTGKTILFPDIEPVRLIENDTIQTNEPVKDYKILLYVDSTGCISCKLRLYIWIACIEELGSKVDFLFYFNPKNKENFLEYLRRERLNCPVYIDSGDSLNKLNKLPVNPAFQCFLLDKDNKVLAIGNPANNFRVWELYKQVITGEMSNSPPVTTVTVDQTEMELNDLHTGKTSEAVFVLKNTGTKPLVIRQVESSCGCTVPDWEKQPIAAGNNTEIKVKITPEKNEYFNKTVTVHCNTEGGQISFVVKGTVK